MVTVMGEFHPDCTETMDFAWNVEAGRFYTLSRDVSRRFYLVVQLALDKVVNMMETVCEGPL